MHNDIEDLSLALVAVGRDLYARPELAVRLMRDGLLELGQSM